MNRLALTLCAITLILSGCQREKPIHTGAELSINLRWNQAYPKEDRAAVETGLVWCFSFLGASLPPGSPARALEWKANVITVDLDQLGFNENAIAAFKKLLPVLKQSDEYARMGGIDVGRFVMLTLNAPKHYYAITSVYRTLDEFRAAYQLDSTKAGLDSSTVSKTHRLVDVPATSDGKALAFIASSGTGNLQNHTFLPREYDALDVMPNGQLRFASYDESGELSNANDDAYTIAGKPAKCLWCHEINLLRPFKATTPLPGFLSPAQFTELIRQRMDLLQSYRASLKSELDFSKKQDHTYAELLYISFSEPSAPRLALEWQMSIEGVQKKLAGLSTHQYPEFPYLGDLYYRKDVDARAPYQSVRVSDSAREKSDYEPDLIQ